jgi:hypothetical protein
MTEQPIYPRIVSEQETRQIIDARVDQGLNQSRIKEMQTQKDLLEKELARYIKLKSRWKKADLGLKIGGMILITGTGITSAVVGTFAFPALIIPLIYPALPAIIGGLGALETALLSGMVMGFTTRKKKFYEEKCNLIRSYLDKLFYYMERIREDGVITTDEILGFRRIIRGKEVFMNLK